MWFWVQRRSSFYCWVIWGWEVKQHTHDHYMWWAQRDLLQSAGRHVRVVLSCSGFCLNQVQLFCTLLRRRCATPCSPAVLQNANSSSSLVACWHALLCPAVASRLGTQRHTMMMHAFAFLKWTELRSGSAVNLRQPSSSSNVIILPWIRAPERK